MERPRYKLEVFEGPLDLLIALIGKKKIDIADIHISEILEQYMSYLAMMREMDLEVTSEFLVMAANLLYIKSKMLLPKAQEEEEDPRAALVQALVEYQRHKESAANLKRLFFENEGIFVRGIQDLPEMKLTYERLHSPEDLKSAFLRIYENSNRRLPPPVASFDGIVGRETAPVSIKLRDLMRRLGVQKLISFFDIFKSAKSRSEIVATFLAVLELTRSKKVRVDSEEDCYDGSRFSLKMENSGEKYGKA